MEHCQFIRKTSKWVFSGGGSTFEQVEDKAQLAPGPVPDCAVCAQQGCSLVELPPPLCPP